MCDTRVHDVGTMSGPPRRSGPTADCLGLFTKRQKDDKQLKDWYGLPSALIKAISDPLKYACGMRDGTIFYFTEATYTPGSPWIYLKIQPRPDSASAVPLPFRGGVDARIADIIWAAENPFGV